jgi:hypothetical protein
MEDSKRVTNLSCLSRVVVQSVGKRKKTSKDACTALLALARPLADQLSTRAAIRSLFTKDDVFRTVLRHYTRIVSAAGPVGNDEQLGVTYVNWSTKATNAFADFANFSSVFDEYKMMSVKAKFVGGVQALISTSATVGELPVTAVTIQGAIAFAYDPDQFTPPATTMTTTNMERPFTRMVSKSNFSVPEEWEWKNPNLPMPWADAQAPSTVTSGGSANNGCFYCLVDPNDTTLATSSAVVHGYLHLSVCFEFRVRF